MTWQTLQEHEAYYLPLFRDDYRRKSLERLVRRFIAGRNVLELRCLTGHLAVELSRRGFEVTALDPYGPAVEETNAHARAQGIGRDIAKTWDFDHLTKAVDGARFDTVLCLDTLVHTSDDEALMAQLAQVMSAGGRLIIDAPAFPALHGKRDAALGHLRRYTKAQLRALVERHGFQIELIRAWNFVALPVYVLIEGLMRRRVSENFRFGRRGPINRVTNRLLRWWYTGVENRLWFPCGLTWFMVARRRQDVG